MAALPFLLPCQSLVVGDTPSNLRWQTDLPSHLLRLTTLTAVPALSTFTFTFYSPTPQTILASASAPDLVYYALADENGQWLSGENGAPYISIPTTTITMGNLVPDRIYILVLWFDSNLAENSKPLTLYSQVTPTITEYFENGLEDKITDSNILVVTEPTTGVTTFTFNNFQFLANTNYQLGKFLNAKRSGTMQLTSSMPNVPSFNDSFNEYGSILISVRSNSTFIANGTITVSIVGVGTPSLQGLLQRNFLGSNNITLKTQWFNDMIKKDEDDGNDILPAKRKSLKY